MTGFSGSYESSDVTFLLKEVQVRVLDVEAKERFIQGGTGHYSEVLSAEKPPAPEYLALFERQLDRLSSRVAGDVHTLVDHIRAARPHGEVVVVSLARAGTPVGVLVHRGLSRLHGRSSTHYCVSIIRDRGLDLNALAYICQRHAPESIVFIDGWTGKGVVGRELRNSVAQFNAKHGVTVDSALHVLADIGGTAEVSATRDDYLLPSAVLNATVSGLVSRTVLNEQVGPDDFHGCMRLPQLERWDRTRQFIDAVWGQMRVKGSNTESHAALATGAELFGALERYRSRFDLASINLVKPGVGESTRVMLRRKPLVLVLRDATHADVQHLVHLAQERQVPVELDPTLPCRALALIDQPD